MKKFKIPSLLITMNIVIISCSDIQFKKTSHSHDGFNHTHQDAVDYFDSYSLINEKYGTKTKVTVSKNKRIMVTNALPNHKTGDFPNSGNPNKIKAQEKTYSFPLNPIYTGKAVWVREPGVALNGIKFEPGTAEVVECESGENYRVEALQDVIDLGLDFNHAHVQPTGAYHYHGTPISIITDFDTGKDLVHIGFAHDGYPIYYSKSGIYKPSYKLLKGTREGEDCSYENPMTRMDISIGGHHDGTYGSDFEYVAGYGDLDECNGIIHNGNYIYLVTENFPYISRCLMGEFKEQKRSRRPFPPDKGPRKG
ncbi:YHYH protein [Aquimarina latercula]|uniref:YHYH protein n=1 Tax=Aquimarina latercula TaxID=987 RepID=UPI0009D74607|nr:YHYH protein [Aquimarina latercula]